METLDKCFENVCELDLIFHVDKVGNASESFKPEYFKHLHSLFLEMNIALDETRFSIFWQTIFVSCCS